MLPHSPAMLDESERKLFTLLALRELGSCSHTQLLYFMVDNGIMTYFDLSLALHELIDEGQAAKIVHPMDVLYQITEAGRETLSFFVNRLAHSKKTLICEQAPAWRERFDAEKHYPAKVFRSPDGEYSVQMRLLDGASSLMQLELPAPDRKLAEQIVQVWPKRAGEIYQFMMRALGEEGTEA